MMESDASVIYFSFQWQLYPPPFFYGDFLLPILSVLPTLLLLCILYLVVSKFCHPKQSEGF